MKIVSFYSIKGGVGKTAASINISYASAAAGYRTLLVDLDPVGAGSYCFKVLAKPKHDGSRIIKGGKTLLKSVRESDYPGLDILPSNFSYRELDRSLDKKKHPRQQLVASLKTLGDTYDMVVLDCTPNISLLAENVLRASDLVLVPVIPTTLSLLALETLMDQLGALSVDGKRIRVFVTMMDRRKKLHVRTVGELIARPEVLKTVIPYCSEIEKMGMYREPVMTTSPASRGALAFASLWKELEPLVMANVPADGAGEISE